MKTYHIKYIVYKYDLIGEKGGPEKSNILSYCLQVKVHPKITYRMEQNRNPIIKS